MLRRSPRRSVQERLREFRITDIAGADISPGEWQNTKGINLNSVYYLLHLGIPELQARGKGSIVTIGSIVACRGFPGHAAYCASNGALVPLIRQVAMDYAPEIRANILCPGPVDTPLLWFSAEAFPNPSRLLQMWLNVPP